MLHKTKNERYISKNCVRVLSRITSFNNNVPREAKLYLTEWFISLRT